MQVRGPSSLRSATSAFLQFVGFLLFRRQRNADTDADDELMTGCIRRARRTALTEHGGCGRLAIAAELHDREFVPSLADRVVFGGALAGDGATSFTLIATGWPSELLMSLK